MSRRLLAVVLTLSIYSFNANAFFFFIPIPNFAGKNDSKEACIGTNSKVGDTFKSSNGNVATIKSITGLSPKCPTEGNRVLALLEWSVSTTFASKAEMNIPDDYKLEDLNETQKFNGIILKATNSKDDTSLQITSLNRELVPDIKSYAEKLKVNTASILDDPEQTKIEELKINGIRALRYETKGKLKNLFGTRYSYLETIMEGDNEIILIESWATTSKFEKHKDAIEQLAFGISGLKPKSTETATKEPVKQTIDTAIKAVSDVTATTNEIIPPAATFNTTVQKLRDLQELKKEGLVTDEEFQTKKKQLLDKM